MDEKRKTKRVSQKNKKGFSLLEVLVAVSIFSLASVMMAGSFSSFLKNSISAKKAQRSAESAQYTMNLMAKTIRTSTLNANSLATPGQITVFDNSQGFCIRYVYEDGLLKMASVGGGGITGIDDCDSATFSTLAPLTKDGDVLGMKTVASTSDVGRVTMVLSLQSGNTLQSSVSLRGSSVAAPPLPSSCDLPWSGTIASGASVTAYLANSVPCGSLCSGANQQQRTCTNGVLSGTFTNQSCSVQACGDTTKPVISTFTVPATSSALTISGIVFAATDNVAVTGYLINESSVAPAAASITLGSAPSSYAAASAGTKTLYAWVKDAAGNVSNVYTGRTCVITIAATATFSWSGAPANSIRIDGVVYGGTGSVAKSGTSMTAKVFGANGQVGGGEPDGDWDYLRARKAGGAGGSRSATFSLVNGETYSLAIGTTPGYGEGAGGAGGYTYAEVSPSKYVAAAGGGGGGEESFDDGYWADGYNGDNAASWRAAIGGGGGAGGTESFPATAGGAGSHADVGETSSAGATWGGYMIDITVTP